MAHFNVTMEGDPSSDELDEEKWQSKNTLWLGDDLSSLGQFRPSYLDEASTSHMHVDPDDGNSSGDDGNVSGDEDDDSDFQE